MFEVLLRKFHEEVCIELSVKLKSYSVLSGAVDVHAETLVEELDRCVDGATFLSFYESFKEEMHSCFLLVGRVDLRDKMDLIFCIIDFVLFDLTIDHTVERVDVGFIVGCSKLVSSKSILKISN